MEYEVIEIPGKHGMIRLHVPKREATEEDVTELYNTVAEVALNIFKDDNKKTAEE